MRRICLVSAIRLWGLKLLASQVGVFLFFSLTGCQTPVPVAGTGEQPVIDFQLSSEDRDMAEALAYYAQAIIDELHYDQDAALSNYVAAAKLDPSNENLQFRIAMAYLQDKKFDEAIQLMERLCDVNPRSEKALLWLALVYRATDQIDKAMETYKRATKVVPESPVAYMELASLYVKIGNEEKAVDWLENGIKKTDHPDNLLHAYAEIYMKQALSGRPDGVNPRRLKYLIEMFEKTREANIQDQAVLYQLGDLYILNDEIEKAIECFEKIEQLNPDDLRIKQKLAMNFMALGDKKKAAKTLEAIARKQPTHTRIFYYLGELYEQMGEKEKAVLNYSLATQGDPPEAAAFLKLAIMQVDEKPKDAIKALQSGIDKIPNEPRLVEMLAYIYLGEKEYEKALEYFSRTQKMLDKSKTEPMTPNFTLNHAIAMQLSGKTTEAATLLYKAMDTNPAFLDAYMQYVFQDKAETNVVQSLRVLNQLGKRSPEDPSLFLYLGLLNSYAKLHDAAISAFERAEELAKQSSEKNQILTPLFYFWYASACERKGQLKKAETLFMKCIQMDPNHAEAYNYLAYMWAEKGVKLEEAMNLSMKSLEMNPGSPAFMDTLGWIYFMQGKYEEALEHIKKAAALLPDDPTIVEHLGDIWDKLGNQQEAIEYWKRSFVLDPENEKVSEKLNAVGVDLKPLRKEADALKKEPSEPSNTDSNMLSPTTQTNGQK